MQLLKRARVREERTIHAPASEPRSDNDERFSRIRCPLCEWRPAPSSRWCCDGTESPEPLFEGCGTVWNTFSTGGRCPGCSHQWGWTSCLRCHGWSLHEDWYEHGQKPSNH
jgi:hypothetical protein